MSSPKKDLASSIAEVDAQPQRSLFDYVSIIRERAVIAIVVATAIVTLYALYALSRTPIYEARAVMLFEERDRVVKMESVDASSDVRNDRALLAQLEQLRSKTFLNYVAKSFTPTEAKMITAPFTDPAKEAPSVANVLQRSLSITQRSNTQVVTIACSHPRAEVAALVANRFAQQYIIFLTERSGTTNAFAVSFLQEQADELQKKVESLEAQMQQYRERFKLVSPEDSQGLIVDRMNHLSAALDAARVEGVSISSQLEQVRSAQAAGLDLAALPAIASNQALQSIMDAIAKAESERVMLGERYLARHPKMIEINSRIDKLNEERAQIVGRSIERLEHAQFENQRRQETLEKGVREAEAQALELDRQSIEYRVLQRRLATERATYDGIVARLNETMITSQLNNANVRIFDEAIAPHSPKSPKRSVVIRNSVALFILVFIGLPIGLSFIDFRVKSVWDIESYLKTRFIGDIPRFKSDDRSELVQAALANQNAILTESFRALYANIKLNSHVTGAKVLVITSTLPSEGKSFVSACLATMCAQHGLKTLLMDCDLRRPSLNKTFDTDNKYGVLRWFQEGGDAQRPDLAAVLGARPLSENLDLVTSGGMTKRPTEVISDERYDALLNRLKNDYDLIIVDTPPVGLFPDAAFVAERADEILYVCRHDHVNRQKVRFAMRRIEISGAHLLGVVMNLVQGRSGHGYYAYGYYGYSTAYYGKEYRKYMEAANTVEEKTAADPKAPTPRS